MEHAGTSLGLNYLSPQAFAASRAALEGHILGVIAFGAPGSSITNADFPYAVVDMPALDSDAIFETWTSEQPVVQDVVGSIFSARTEDLLFGCLTADAENHVDTVAHRTYCNVFDCLDRLGYVHLLRVWNYFPRINSIVGDLERYRQFNIGRHEAFLASKRDIPAHAPAASALGSRRGPLIVYFLAARHAGQSIDNPRQVNAYRYPVQYGPRSPVFARAKLAQTGTQCVLMVSGTASIVGHETLHAGDAHAQAQETVENLLALFERARQQSSGKLREGTMLLKAYVRHPDYAPYIREALTRAFGGEARVVTLQADICRAELLVEVEGVYIPNRSA